MDYPRYRFWTKSAALKTRDDSSLTKVQDVNKRLEKSILQTTWDLFTDYSNVSTVHGFKYMGEKNRSWFERIVWMIVFVISFLACGFSIRNVWTNWDQNPVIVTFAAEPMPIWKIPFPAITICPEIKARKDYIDVTKAYHMFNRNKSLFYNLDASDQAMVTAVSQVCLSSLFNHIDPEGRTDCSNCIETLREIGFPLENVLPLCSYRNGEEACSDMFEEVITEEGVCYTFNAMNVFEPESYRYNATSIFPTSNWSLEQGYKSSDLFETYPRRALGSGMRFGLFALLNLCEPEFDYVCRGPVQGFKILLHIPTEIPQLSKHFYRIPLEQEIIIVVKPVMMTTSDGLRSYSPEKRNCFFNNEKKLRHFRLYTQRNCELECLTNFTLKRCGCIKFNMPRSPGVKICGTNKLACLEDAEIDLLQLEVEQELGELHRTDCNCLPSCIALSYEAEISQANFDMEEFFKAREVNINLNGCQFTRLTIVFKEDQLITARRSELYKGTDFLANCGGLLGLFMGMSFMSILEIFYFCTIRLYCNLKTSRKPLPTPPIVWVNTVSGAHKWR